MAYDAVTYTELLESIRIDVIKPKSVKPPDNFEIPEILKGPPTSPGKEKAHYVPGMLEALNVCLRPWLHHSLLAKLHPYVLPEKIFDMCQSCLAGIGHLALEFIVSSVVIRISIF